MADAMIPALGRDFADSPLFDLACDLARSHARVAFPERSIDPPEYDVHPAFETLSKRQRLEIAESVCRRGSPTSPMRWHPMELQS